MVYLFQLHVVIRENGDVQSLGNGLGNGAVLLGLAFFYDLARGQAQAAIFVAGGRKTEQTQMSPRYG